MTRVQVVEVQVDVVLVRADAAAFADLDGHRAADHVAGQDPWRRRIALHETLALGIGQIAALAAHALGDQAPGAVNAGGMELHELHVLKRQACAQHHAVAITGAGMRRGAGEIGAPVAAGGQITVWALKQVQVPSSRFQASTPCTRRRRP